MGDEPGEIPSTGHLTIPEAEWKQARLRADVIGTLAKRDRVGLAAADEAALALSISRRQVYVLLDRYRRGSGLVTDLVGQRSHGGKGGKRLSEQVEQVIRELVRKRYLTKQKRSIASVHREIVRICTIRGLPAPARNTVETRIARMNPVEVGRRRDGPDSVRPLQSAGDDVPVIESILDQVQIDHTVIDLIVVDERERQPVGRPYLTAAIDVFSRCLIGMVVTLEPPSAVSVGLCLAHTAGDKRPRVERLGVEADWPMSGKPKALFVDNAAEFKSEALTRGCQQHGIALDYRPLGQPHYGGIVERVIGTAMRKIHELPGTTFSDPGERGRYESEELAALTLVELEKWLTLAVAAYHGTVHSTLGLTPAGRWAEGIVADGPPVVTSNPTAFLVDFLPVMRRKLTRTGFVIDHVRYFANVLKPWIARRESLERFIIRRDPRDIGRIWVLDPEGAEYVEVPYRTLSNPAVSVWEHRQALARLRERGAAQVDEAALFRMIEQMRHISETAEKTTKRTRREAERRTHAGAAKKSPPASAPAPPPPAPEPRAMRPAARFDEIEPW
ncbi:MULTISPECIES: Mu transposase C-terminal domain-containing protein [Brevibacterium]|uniref:Transposase n=1 Tax=Brevibacterium aurantiacum TaxID=273384 RepID=A0A2A3Z761_BREAU|nr:MULTISPECIES: Mu transposase C-terminal domain-containing protein [Brevibacterium]PCC47337.1 transposase [Brevibacterium aurantiacum]SMY05004.1 putative transposase [Brevibacterium sp. 239c]